jgi:hypothetical protein
VTAAGFFSPLDYLEFDHVVVESLGIAVSRIWPPRNVVRNCSFADGQLKMPPQWIGTNVVKLKRAKKRARSSRGFFILRFGLGLESTLELHQLGRRWRLAEHLSRAFLRLTSNQPRCCQLRRSLLPRCSEPRPSHQLEHQFVQMKRY